MGIGSQTTTQIAARFTADVVDLKPKVVIMEGGVNDLATSVTKATFITNWTNMLNAAQASSSICTIEVLKILHGQMGQTVQCKWDDWNASLTTLAASYSKASLSMPVIRWSVHGRWR
jgi:lysophospholipase L1-like esterase